MNACIYMDIIHVSVYMFLSGSAGVRMRICVRACE